VIYQELEIDLLNYDNFTYMSGDVGGVDNFSEYQFKILEVKSIA
jgi:hypothetical protein